MLTFSQSDLQEVFVTVLGIRPSACPSYFSLAIKMTNISVTVLKKKGRERGSPRLKIFFEKMTNVIINGRSRSGERELQSI